MLEIILLRYFKKNMEVPAFMETPEKEPKRYILLEKTGGSMENHICYATIAVQSYAESMYEAAVLNEEVKGVILNGFVRLPEISKVKLNTDYNFTDTTKKKYRYQAIYDITYQEGSNYGE
ncbi:MAG: hypothetical protein E7299_04825 [Lachnospiraceae bacterium]|nr:hypothetical protein [Lachnospiraceae bacterium]